MGDITEDGSLLLYAEGGEAKLIPRHSPEASRTLDEPCGTNYQLSTLRFSRSGAHILAARQAFISVYDRDGNLLAKTCRWHTKDQWNYLELLQNDSLLLASANEGQVMFFEIRTGDGEGSLHALTGEFEHRERSGGAIVWLDVSEDTKFMLSTHHLGSAFLWHFETKPRPHLMKIKEFGLPPSRRNAADHSVKLTKADEEFITSAEMSNTNGETFFVTSYKSGAATQWKLVQDTNIDELRTLAHGEATVMYAGFSADGSRIITLADDRSLKIWDTVSGDILAVEQAER